MHYIMFNRKWLKLIAFLVIGLFAWFWTSFAENEVIVNDVTYNWTYPPYWIDITITTSIKIKWTPNLILEYDNPGVKYMISARIDSCWDVGCFGKIKYDKELPTWKYIGKIIFSYQKSDSSERYTATGSYTLDIIQPDFEEDWVSVNDIIFNDIIAWYKHKKLQPVVIKNDTEKRVVITSISVKSDMLGIEDMFKWTLQAEEIGILEYNGVLNAWTYTGKLVVWYWEKFGQEIDQATGLITINVIPINNISELTSTNIDFWQIEWWYEDIDEKVITVINPTDSEIVIKWIRLDTSDNPNINEVFEVLDSENFTILGPKEAIDFATVTMKKWLHLGLYTGKVEIIYQKDDKEYSIRSYLTGNIVGKETIDELILTWSLPKDWTKFWDYQFNPIFNKDYVTLKNYELFAYDENAWDWWNWVKVEDPEHVFNTSAEYSLRMYMEISDSYTIWENTDITYYFDRFSWEDWYDFDSWIRFYDCHFWNDSFVINISSNNEDYWIVSTSRTKARYWEYITLTATPKDWYRFKEWQTENDIEINDNYLQLAYTDGIL